MFRQESNSEVSSNEKTFDFNYKLDISNRKGHTGENFTAQDGFDIDDFGDFREDRTQKSEITTNRKVLPS